MRLGELDLPSMTDALFQLGELLARTNATGGLLSPLRLRQVSMTMLPGQWAFNEAACVTPNAFTPARAAQQFAEFEGDMLPLVLSGYARLAYQQLDLTYPGFTDSLLAELLPGVEVVIPKPRPISFDLAAVLQAYGTSLDHYLSTRKVSPVPAPPPATSPSEEDLLIATLVLFLAQRDLTAWLMQVAACEPTQQLPNVLGALARGEFYTSGWDGLLPKLIAWVAPRKKPRPQIANPSALVTVVLAVLTEAYSQPGRLAEIQEKQAAFHVLQAALDQLPPESPDVSVVRPHLLASLMDGLHALAEQAEARGQVTTSMYCAQCVLKTMQLLPAPANPEQAETWLARVQAQEYTYHWSRLAPDQSLDPTIVRSYVGYAGAAGLMAALWSDAAGRWYSRGQITNQLWTAIWFGLERLRLALRLFAALSQQEPLPVGMTRQQATRSLQYLFAHYKHAQLALATMLTLNLQPGREMSMWVQTLLDSGAVSLADSQIGYDLRALKPAEDALQRYGYGPEVVAQLGKLATFLVPVVPKMNSTLPVAEPADLLGAYEAEEDQLYQQVLTPLLHQAYVIHASQIQQVDGSPLIPPPASPLSGAELEAYREEWLLEHPTALSPPGVLNLSPTLHSLPECVAEYQFLLDQALLPARTQTLHQLASEPWVASLRTRSFTPVPVPEVWRYTAYWRYAPFQQYPQPADSQGEQLGLRLSRVGFNATRDTGFFFYDLDYQSHILGNVAVVRKQAGRWLLQTDDLG